MTTKDSEKVDNIIYSYATDISQLEEENRILKETLESMKSELSRLKRTPLMVCEVKELLGQQAIIRIPNGNSFFVEVSEECDNLTVGDTVLTEQKNLTILKKINATKNFDVDKFVIIDKPDIDWKDIGGLSDKVDQIKEVIELPLKKPKLLEKVGIKPPKGILLYGPPGTGKTLLAKAVAKSTNATFIQIVGSELVQKFIGEGAKLVKEIFQLAKENAPSIIFIDEIDALAATRMDIGTSGEREVQRTFMQLLAEIDGFKSLSNVKIIGCTNRKDILDPAITRPGRLDRLIHVPNPDLGGVREIFKIHTKSMNTDIKNLDKIVKNMEGFSGAEIHAVCTEAGYCAIRDNRTKVSNKDFLDAIQKIKDMEATEDSQDYLSIFG
ncbi:AAA family ATPase [Candidatus Woesearchaeota archaeon]|nr:AAA family ATPase [Candidatus Woesearchaeota archaeon]